MPDFFSQIELPALPSIFPGHPPGRNSTWGDGNREVWGAGGYGPWGYSGRLYMLTRTYFEDDSFSYNFENSYFNVYRSDDGGISWTVRDSDHAPRYGLVGHFNQLGSKITVFCVVDAFDFWVYQLFDFDLVTDTWGDAYAVGMADEDFNGFCRTLTRKNGNTALISSRDFTPTLQMNEWNGTAWTTPFPLNAPGEGAAFLGAMLEPESGNIHLEYERAYLEPQDVVHRVIRPDNSLGPITVLWTGTEEAPIGDGWPMPIAFFKDKVYIYRYDNTHVSPDGFGGNLVAGYYASVGTPASEPTSFTSVPVSGLIPQISMSCGCTVVSLDGSKLHFIYGYNNPANPGGDPESLQYHRAETTNGTDWANTLFFDFWPQNPQYFIISAMYSTLAGVDGIGAFAMTGFETPYVVFFMLKTAAGPLEPGLRNFFY